MPTVSSRQGVWEDCTEYLRVVLLKQRGRTRTLHCWKGERASLTRGGLTEVAWVDNVLAGSAKAAQMLRREA